MPTYAEWVSTAALSLSTVSLGWQVRRAAQEGPRLGVRAVQIMGFRGPSDPLEFMFSIKITNYGTGPTTITDLGWEREQEQGGIYSVRRAITEPKLKAVHGAHVDGSPIPHRIDASDEVEWVMTETYMDRFQRERVRAVATTVGTPKSRAGRLIRRGGKPERLVSAWVLIPEFGVTWDEYDAKGGS